MCYLRLKFLHFLLWLTKTILQTVSVQWAPPEINLVSVIQIIFKLYRNSGADLENSVWWVLKRISFLLFVFYVCHDVLSVHCSLVVTCWEMDDLLALLYVVISCVFVTFPYGVFLSLSHMVSWVRCDIWFLIFFYKFIFHHSMHHI